MYFHTLQPSEVEMWEQAIERWDELYYCYRDDGVFLPSQTRFVRVNDLQALFYSLGKKKC